MRNRILYTVILLFTVIAASAADINVRTRQEIGAMLTRIVAREVSGGNVKVEGVKASNKRVQLYTSIGMSYYPFREQSVQAIYDSVRLLLPADMRRADIEIITDQREISELIPMAYRTKVPDKKKKIVAFTNRSARPLVVPMSEVAAPVQGLSGRHIALWQSHGRYFDQTRNCWRWQRSRLWMTCEDLYTQSYVLPYLVPMLENAGAVVMLPRERDVQKHEVLADNDAAGQYSEVGTWQTGGAGFAHTQNVYHTGENPFRHGTTRKTRTVTGAADSRAVWSAYIPERGEYAVYVSYESTSGSADDALYTVSHLGGESRFEVNQTMGGGTWIYLGTFLLEAGAQDVVSLSNLSRQAGRMLSADAVKIGGGYGNVVRSVDASLRKKEVEYLEETSGYPRFCEGARYWLQWAGLGTSVYTPKENKDDYKDDYMSRAHWVNALMGGSERLPDSTGLRIPIDMALAFHSDAGVRAGDEVIGTLGIFYTKDKDTKGRFAGGADRYRSRDLTDIVMTQIVSDIRQTYEPEWMRRGLWNRSYYEARVPGAPTMLLELMSHQNFADMRYGNDPRFKFLVSRAVYKGILRYISSQYGTPYAVQPLPVEAFSAEFEGLDGVRLGWSPTVDELEASASPTGYVVYTRVGDGGFDSGRYVAEPTLLVSQKLDQIYSYKVTAINDGGESFPSEILSACHVSRERGRVLVVNGFDRICAPASMRADSLAGFQWGVDDGVPDKRDISFIGGQRVYDLSMARSEDDRVALGACETDHETDVIGGNTFDYPYLHGRSIAAAGYSFCSASVRSVERGEVSVDAYRVMDLILGKQRSTTIGRGVTGWEFKTFSPELQSALRRMLAAGGSLFVSGSYVVSDLWAGENSTDTDRAFAREVLHCADGGNFAPRQPRVRVVASSAVDFSNGEYRFCTEILPDRYRVETTNALIPSGRGAFGVMRYMGDNQTAGVAYNADARTFVMGFPFEALMTEAERDRVMRDVLGFLVKQNNR